MKIKKTSLLKRVATFVFVAAGSLVGSYLITPNKTVSVDLGGHGNTGDAGQDINEDTYFSHFVTKLMNTIDESSEESINGLKANLNNLEITWPSKSGLSTNDIKINGLINLKMKSLQDFNATIDLEADYNSRKLDLGLGLVDQTLYVSIDELNIKSSHSSTLELVNTINDLFFNPENENGLGIDLDLAKTINGLFDLDLGSMSLDGFKVVETEIGNNVEIKLQVMEGICPIIVVEKETLNLVSLDLNEIKVGNITIDGSLACEVTPELVVYGLDDVNYTGKKRTDFVEVINYIDWADRLLGFLQTKKVGLNIEASIDQINADNTISRFMSVEAGLNVDAETLFDVKEIDLNALVTKANDTNTTTDETDTTTTQSFLDKILDNLKFDASLTVKGQNAAEDYANMSLAYFDRTGYLSLNEYGSEAVMRAKIQLETVKEIIDKVPAITASLTQNTDTTESKPGLFDFVTSSELVTAIKDGVYDGILGLIDTLKNTENTIEVVLNLSSLGFGENSKVGLILDSSENAITNGSKVIELTASNIKIGSIMLNLDLTTEQFTNTKINSVKANASKYDDMGFVSGIFDQVSTILDTKKAYIGLEGSMLDNAGLGFTFDGWAQFDYGNKFGFGSMTFEEYKTSANELSATHTLDIDVDNSGVDNRDKNMLFEYREKLKGKFTVQTLLDIVNLGKNLLNEDDVRFTKFVEPIKDLLLVGTLREVLDSKDYLALAKSSFIKKIAQNQEGTALDVVIAKEVMGFDNDLTIRLGFDLSKNKALKTIEVMGLVFSGKNISLKVTIDDYKDSLTTPVDKTAAFYDFSDIAVLLEFGINTTKLNVYHLKLPLNIKILSIVNLDITLDFYVKVDGVKVMVYGKIPSVPYILGFSEDFGTIKVSSEMVFEPSRDASNNDIGGFFHILRTEDGLIAENDASYYYRSDSKNFVNNIAEYLLCDLLNLKPSILEKITTSSTEPVENSNYEDLFEENGFVYTHTNSEDTWNLKLNLKALTGSSYLGVLNLILKGVYVNGIGYYTSADISTTLTSAVQIKGKLQLFDPNPAIKDWPTSIENRYQRIIGLYNNMNASTKANFDLNYFNKPNKEYKLNTVK